MKIGNEAVVASGTFIVPPGETATIDLPGSEMLIIFSQDDGRTRVELTGEGTALEFYNMNNVLSDVGSFNLELQDNTRIRLLYSVTALGSGDVSDLARRLDLNVTANLKDGRSLN